MIVKKHISQGKLILAICDKELLGKVFEEGKFILDLSSEFYNGEETNEEQLEGLLKKVYIINAVGKKSVGFLKKNNIIENTNEISNIPYAQVVIEH